MRKLGKPVFNDQNRIFGKISIKSNKKEKSSFKDAYFNRVLDEMIKYDITDITGLTLKDIMSLDYSKYQILIRKLKLIKEKHSSNKDVAEDVITKTKDAIKKYDKKLKKRGKNV